MSSCPLATLNPATGEPVDEARVYTVFREGCYDDEDDPQDTWDHRSKLARGALDEATMLKRDAFAVHVMGLRYTVQWYFYNLVWCDLCNSILPRTRKKAQELALARKGGKGWMSEASQNLSENYRLPKALLKRAVRSAQRAARSAQGAAQHAARSGPVHLLRKAVSLTLAQLLHALEEAAAKSIHVVVVIHMWRTASNAPCIARLSRSTAPSAESLSACDGSRPQPSHEA